MFFNSTCLKILLGSNLCMFYNINIKESENILNREISKWNECLITDKNQETYPPPHSPESTVFVTSQYKAIETYDMTPISTPFNTLFQTPEITPDVTISDTPYLTPYNTPHITIFSTRSEHLFQLRQELLFELQFEHPIQHSFMKICIITNIVLMTKIIRILHLKCTLEVVDQILMKLYIATIIMAGNAHKHIILNLLIRTRIYNTCLKIQHLPSIVMVHSNQTNGIF